ncbi:GNAT family N-acetyltransferase [Metabacillus litoralis]|uniref:GNAT family N-acetyltransferase n=1 Tax=Metabacillus litoralis TaxID=152268 RepID=UPI001CFED8A9|nr:GNAT family protein [Metabacillus litoralis]
MSRIVTLRKKTKEDLPILWNYKYGKDHPEWKKWDAPYFPLEFINYDEYVQQFLDEDLEKSRIIEVDGVVIGYVGYYWEYEQTKWLEAGIVIYDPSYWSGGYGTKALSLWIDHLFQTLDIPRVGITTWSGNERMMKLAEKLGMKLEGRMRKCRYYNEVYYDSIRMGILREEWDEMKATNTKLK